MPDYFYEPSVLRLSGFKLTFRVKIIRTMQENLLGYNIYLILGDERIFEYMNLGYALLKIQSGYYIGRKGICWKFYNQMSKYI